MQMTPANPLPNCAQSVQALGFSQFYLQRMLTLSPWQLLASCMLRHVVQRVKDMGTVQYTT